MIDTLTISKRLQQAKLNKEAADEIADIFGDTVRDELTTKADLREMELRLRNFIMTVAGTASTAIVAVLAAIKYSG